MCTAEPGLPASWALKTNRRRGGASTALPCAPCCGLQIRKRCEVLRTRF